MLSVADPAVTETGLRVTPSMENTALPPMVPAKVEVTVAVKVTPCPKTEVGSEEVTVVVVLALVTVWTGESVPCAAEEVAVTCVHGGDRMRAHAEEGRRQRGDARCGGHGRSDVDAVVLELDRGGAAGSAGAGGVAVMVAVKITG